jgi:hypothetical protein
MLRRHIEPLRFKTVFAALVEQINARRARQRPKLLYFSLYRGKLFLVRRCQLIVQKPDLIRAIR